MLLALQDVGVSFGAEQIFEHLTATVEPRERIALIGPNGAGKTTLLNLIAGQLEPDTGEIGRKPGLGIGYLRQNGGLDAHGTIESEMRDALSEVYELERKLLEAGERMAEVTDHQSERYRALEAEYQRLDVAFASRDGYQAQVKINTVLTGMGFGAFDRASPVETLSGGERTRLMLAKLLLEGPELLILDEATNHLDFKMLAWLEDYLAGYRGAIVTVSHDRYFLDRVTRSTWELEGLALVCYPAPYSGYLTLRAERIERMEKEYERYAQERARLLDYAERNMARASTSQSAKSRLRMVEHMGEAESPPAQLKPPRIRFTPKLRPVSRVLTVEGLTLSVGAGEQRRVLVSELGLDVMRGDRLAIIGENGAGKSTLLRALVGRRACDKGRIEWGRNVRLSVYEQDSSELHSEKTAIEELWDRFPGETEHGLRTLIGGLGLTGDESFKKVGVLSGGERARIKLAIAMLEQGNVLVMDEPTNHLDIPAKEALEAALLAFDGTVLVVSHDRWLLSRLPTRILRLADGTAELFEGGFETMQAQLAARDAENAGSADKLRDEPEKSERGGEYHRSRAQRSAEAAQKRRTAELEQQIAEIEQALLEAERQMEDPAVAGDYQALSELTRQMEELHDSLDGFYAEWDTLL